MDFEVYCDESGLEALTNKVAHSYTAIGGIWFPASYRAEFKQHINDIKQRHNITGELKWQKVSPAFSHVYQDLIDYFFSDECLRFRVIIIEASKVDNMRFNGEDAELGFYKFYYQLLHHWIYDYNSYDIFLDLKVNRNKGRLNELHRVLSTANLTAKIKQVQGLPSEQSPGIQLADVLTGLVSSKYNAEVTGEAKLNLIRHVETTYLNRPISHSPKTEEKFNIFKINLKGGW